MAQKRMPLKRIPAHNVASHAVHTQPAAITPKRRAVVAALCRAQTPLAALALGALAACSTVQQDAAQPQVWATLVDASAGSTPGEPVLGGLVTQKITAGRYWQVVPDMFAVRECDAGAGICRQGIAKPVARVTVRQVGTASATVTFQAEYDVGPSQTLTNGLPVSTMTTTMSIPEGVAPMPKHVELVGRTAELPYGQLRKVTLPNGVMLGLCLSASREPVMPPSGACPAGTDEHFGEALASAASL
ncbi:hypothetical protein [Burkholderia multivorans]|uniref:hypothetical protein n=1 Tax=Burkholderia multivorans TaxID=87883 RepID=UPI000A6491C4|nr:hypothetical protein [Burkholderia multivorans]